MLRVTKDRKRKYSSIGISINPVYWDFEKNKPRRNCPDKERIEQIIAEQVRKYREQILDYQAEDKEFTPASLHDRVTRHAKIRTVDDLFRSHIADHKSQRRSGYALTFSELYNSLMQFNGHLDIYFSDIDTIWLKRYEMWQRGQHLLENTIGKRFRTLRVLYNIAIECNLVKRELYPSMRSKYPSCTKRQPNERSLKRRSYRLSAIRAETSILAWPSTYSRSPTFQQESISWIWPTCDEATLLTTG